MSQRIATRARTRDPRTGASAATSAPSATTSRQIRVSVPPCGSIAEWNFSAPKREARNWKNMTASDPRATWARLLRAISPGRFAMLRGCQFTADVECSMSIHGRLPAKERVRSASSASITWLSRRSAVR